jgi:ribonucleoside-diphosphate reductase alpha chain
MLCLFSRGNRFFYFWRDGSLSSIHTLRPASPNSNSTGGGPASFDAHLHALLADICQGFEGVIDQSRLRQAIEATFPDDASDEQCWQAILLAARAQIEMEPAYTFVAARALLLALYQEACLSVQAPRLAHASALYEEYFAPYLQRGVAAGQLDPRLLDFDLERLAPALCAERDLLFTYPGLQTLYDRYFLQSGQQRIELPQLF